VSPQKTYRHRTLVAASPAAVAGFHNSSRVLKDLTPPLMFLKLNRFEPLAEGSIADFTLWLGPLPVRWVAIHSEVSQDGFIDTQQSGPFKTWRHRHSFRPVSPQLTEVLDEIQAEFSEHFFWGLVSRLMWLNMPVLFGYRGWVTRRRLKGRYL
jgi:ligand-binding SRPBCC domain-containing protein